MRKKAAIFISGGGSNMLALLEAAKDPSYPVEFVAVISDNKNAGGLAKAEAQGRSDFTSMWAGQRASACREMSAAALTRLLVARI